MPRRSSGGSSRSRSAPRQAPAAHTPARNPPQPATPTPTPAPAQGGNGSMMGGLGAVVADGLAFGTGSAVAHRAVDAIMGPRVIQHETVPSSAPAPAPAPSNSMNTVRGLEACNGQYKALQDCLSNYGSDISKCQFYMDMLQECRKGPATALGA